MLTVHHLENSRSQRILWLLEELGADYEIKHYKRSKTTNLAPAELKDIHPLGKSPVITHGDHVIAETGAIVEYILETIGGGRFMPAEEVDKLRYKFWLHYAEGSAMPPLLIKLVLDSMETKAPALIRPIVKAATGKVKQNFLNPQLNTHLSFINDELMDVEWFVGGELSGADFMMSFPLEAAANRAGASDYPAIKAFLARIHDRPAYKTALEKGGPYAFA